MGVRPLARNITPLVRALPSTTRSVEDVLDSAGALPPSSSLDAVRSWLENLRANLDGSGAEFWALVREGAKARLKKVEVVSAPAQLVDALLSPPKSDGADGISVAFEEPKAGATPVTGAKLALRLSRWVRGYVYMPKPAADAIAFWIIATHFGDKLYFAPILTLLSATRRCGKTLLLDVLRPVVRYGYTTSGVGLTPAVLFRLNDAVRPTFLVDEAEKLRGRHADRELISMFNVGYRRGARIQRCAEKRSGEFQIQQFDAFGFRALAAVGTLWDTIMDRAIVISLERKPRTVKLRRFKERVVADEGRTLAGQIVRWLEDGQAAVEDKEFDAPRPSWLNDRACDTWSGIFAIAAVMGHGWPARIEAAAKSLSEASPHEDRDDAERLIHDIRATFAAENDPEVIKSGELVAKLNAVEAAPWGEYRRGQGISTHKLAAMLRSFRIRPRHGRTEGGSGPDFRGYWLVDLRPVLERYAPAADPSQVSQASEHAGFHGLETVTASVTEAAGAEVPEPARDITRDSSPQAEKPTGTPDVTDVTVTPPGSRAGERADRCQKCGGQTVAAVQPCRRCRLEAF